MLNENLLKRNQKETETIKLIKQMLNANYSFAMQKNS